MMIPRAQPQIVIRHMLRTMTRLAALAMIAVTLAMPAAQAQTRGQGDPIVIWNNKGGNVVKAMQYREKLAASGRRVEIRGYCRSACTIYITLPNACLGPQARVGFHAPRIPNTQIIPPIVDELMARYYRNGILQKWNGGWNRSIEMHKITAREYVRLDPQTRLCRN
ncbi:hypothetical protein [Paracoccus laeviglucosivorans]|uniref:Uncharacterized protein n=1 Tax=Paracoccus laeviglucosivorans TaxID=1197861 RepID=A0A521E6V7_9RHOB|nr:hypothetical protein [Paracoccus laeviglucosivorans]SMO79673.1 hypothetical protein SAMN06265221_111121 [Paracoccus laeviglucosivorans]